MSDDEADQAIPRLVADIAAERERIWADMLALAEYGGDADEQDEQLEEPMTKALETQMWLAEMQSKPPEELTRSRVGRFRTRPRGSRGSESVCSSPRDG